MASVSLENLCKTYQGSNRPAVQALNLHIHDAEFLVLVGPSGCGKSTTLRMIAGLEEVTSGTIRIGERSVNHLPPKDRDIAMVFQNYALYPHMNVFRNMSLGLDLRRRQLGLSRAQIRDRVQETARILRIEEFLDRKPRVLSGGQRQRVALGRAIVRNPKAFLFDEPLSNLDAQLRLETRAELKKLHQRLQTTTVYVTHDQEEAMTLGDRIVVMRDGIVQQCAPPLDVYDRPVNRFVASFVGNPPMNFLRGAIRADGGGPVSFAFGDQMITLPPPLHRIARQFSGRELLLGIRPEALSPATEVEAGVRSGARHSFDAKVNVLEPLGDRVDIALSATGIDQIVCRADAHQFGNLPVGGIIKVSMDLGRVHLFEPGENGVNITLTRESSHAAA